MEISKVPIDSLKPWVGNPRMHRAELDMLIKSISHYGWTNPILAQKGTNRIIAGHGRIEAAKRLGLAEVPVIFLEMDDKDADAYTIADNRLAELSEWDRSALKDILESLDDGDFDMDLTGFDEAALEELMTAAPPDVEILDPQCDEDETPDLPKEAITKPGDLIILGRHRLLCGDSTSITDVERLMDGKKADMVFTDPPYNVDYQGKTKDALTIENDAMSPEEFRAFLLASYRVMLSVTKPGGPIYVCHADSEGEAFPWAMREAGWLLKQTLVWVKHAFVMGRQDYHWQHESILYGWAPGAAHQWHGDRKQSTVWEFDRPFRNDLHPTMKPVALVDRALLNSSAAGALLFEPFGGSGSTLISAEQTGRTCYLMELDPKYCDVIVERWEKYTGKKAQRP